MQGYPALLKPSLTLTLSLELEFKLIWDKHLTYNEKLKKHVLVIGMKNSLVN